MATVIVGGQIKNTLSTASLDKKYGPYLTTQAAWDELGPDGLDCACIGLTVGIQPTASSPIIEYWFKNAASAVTDLVEKQSGSSSNVFYLHADLDMEAMTFTATETKAQIQAAIDAGKDIIMLGDSGDGQLLNMLMSYDTDEYSVMGTLANQGCNLIFEYSIPEEETEYSGDISVSQYPDEVSVSDTGTSTNEISYITIGEEEYKIAGGSGGTSDFDQLTNRPKYNSVEMTHETNIVPFTGATTEDAGTIGLVPKPGATAVSKFLRGDGTWADIGIDSMEFKGTLGTGGTVTTLPTAQESSSGWTYKVITAGTYMSIDFEVGDLAICGNPDGSYQWIRVPSGAAPGGSVTNVATGTGLTGGPITSSGTIALDMTGATAGQVLTATTASTVGWADSTGGNVKYMQDTTPTSASDKELWAKGNADGSLVPAHGGERTKTFTGYAPNNYAMDTEAGIEVESYQFYQAVAGTGASVSSAGIIVPSAGSMSIPYDAIDENHLNHWIEEGYLEEITLAVASSTTDVFGVTAEGGYAYKTRFTIHLSNLVVSETGVTAGGTTTYLWADLTDTIVSTWITLNELKTVTINFSAEFAKYTTATQTTPAYDYIDNFTSLAGHDTYALKVYDNNTWKQLGGNRVSVSNSGTSTDEVSYITIDGVECKLPSGGSSTTEVVFATGTMPSTEGETFTLDKTPRELKEAATEGKLVVFKNHETNTNEFYSYYPVKDFDISTGEFTVDIPSWDSVTTVNAAVSGEAYSCTHSTSMYNGNFHAIYNSTTYQEINEAMSAEKNVIGLNATEDVYYQLADTSAADGYHFSAVRDNNGTPQYEEIKVSSDDVWSTNIITLSASEYIKSVAIAAPGASEIKTANKITFTKKDNNTVVYNPDFSKVSASATGTSTDTISYITIDDAEYKIAGGSGSVEVDNVTIDRNASNQLEVKDAGLTLTKMAAGVVDTTALTTTDDTHVASSKLISTSLAAKENIAVISATQPTTGSASDMWIKPGAYQYKHNGTVITSPTFYVESATSTIMFKEDGIYDSTGTTLSKEWSAVTDSDFYGYIISGDVTVSTVTAGHAGRFASNGYDYIDTFTYTPLPAAVYYHNGTMWLKTGEIDVNDIPVDGTTIYVNDDGELSSSGPSIYLKGAAVVGRTLTLTKQDDSTITFSDTGVQSVTESSINGYINVDSTNVYVHGLSSAAFKPWINALVSGSDALITSGAVYSTVSAFSSAMIFKGTLGSGGTISSLPTASSTTLGWTYKVITAGEYVGQQASVGDVFICGNVDGYYQWVRVPAGESTDTWRNITINGSDWKDSTITSGPANLVPGTGISLTPNGNDLTIASTVTYSLDGTTLTITNN